MTLPAIKVEGLFKQYVVGSARKRDDTFYDLLARAVKFPFRKSTGSEDIVGERSKFLALRDINFEVQPGEALGIIGRNGAGKSTLLKILSRITSPTRGKVTTRGRVASLLEVGTGFHPELTGRENVFLNGAILGMRRREIQSRFDEIVDFAEVEKFIDTPVKHYSSGMGVRLAFAVAAHLEPDILIADEVLAVGDLAFQRKCMGKMRDAAGHGRTVLFVSHNLTAVRNLCQSILLIESGSLVYLGPVERGIANYERSLVHAGDSLANARFEGPLSKRLRFEEFTCRQGGAVVTIVDPLKDVEIEIRGSALKSFQMLDLNIGFYRENFHLAYCHDAPRGTSMREGRFSSKFRIKAGALRPGRYSVEVGAVAGTGEWTVGPNAAVLEVSENWRDDSSARDRGALGIDYSAERIQ